MPASFNRLKSAPNVCECKTIEANEIVNHHAIGELRFHSDEYLRLMPEPVIMKNIRRRIATYEKN
jgi:hypothetical protein